MATLRSNRPLTAVGIILTVATVLIMSVVLMAPASGGGPDDGLAAFTAVAPDDVIAFATYAEGMPDSEWCAVLAAHPGDWDTVREMITAAAGSWRQTPEALTDFVALQTAVFCPAEAEAFLASHTD